MVPLPIFLKCIARWVEVRAIWYIAQLTSSIQEDIFVFLPMHHIWWRQPGTVYTILEMESMLWKTAVE